MSENETGKTMPSPDVLYASGSYLTRYRAAFTSLRVDPRPDRGRRIVINDDGHEVIFDLDAAQVSHLLGLLEAEGGSAS